MNEFTPLNRPQQSQVTIDSIAKDCPSGGFNYPTFRQLNKQARIYLSQPFSLNPSVSYHLFAVSNSKGWFAAVQSTLSGSALIFSPLEDLRSAFTAAKEDAEGLFSPKRTLSIQAGNVNIIDFACNDTRLIVGLENGSLGVYDTASLFTPGTEPIQPLRTAQVQSSPLRQIAPNPGTEANLSELFAVVGDGKVQLLNMQLEPQGGWEGTDLMSQPISVAWSPKGKHIAIGLQTGDILTFSLTNKSTPHKHIPPTSDAILVSLNWLGPGHTFRTSYGAQGDIAAKQHIIVLDTKSSTAIYFAPDHPYPSYDRTQQNAFVLTLHKWDEEAASQADSKSLTVVGDVSSVDLEVLGNVGNNWHRHSQENQLSLPLDKSMDDTILLALEADLTDSSTNAPIMYAYLNDGSLQGWHAEHPSSKPYLGMITLGASSSTAAPATQASKDADMGIDAETPSTSAFAQPAPTTSAFGQPSFGQMSSPFGQTGGSTFGQSSFGQAQKAPAFGQSSFGQPSTTSAFGSFGQANQTNDTTSAFGAVKPAAGFGAFGGGGSTGAFGSGSSVGFGSAATPSAFSSFASNTTGNVFGQGSFGAPAAASSPPENADPTSMTREASMSDSTSGFGSMGLGSATPSDPNAVNSMFGSIQPGSSNNQTQSTSAFGGGLVKPASGFGAFGSFGSGGAFDPSNKPAPTVSAFSTAAPATTTTTSSRFGQSGFGQTSFGKPSFGQPAFGKTSLGATRASTTAPLSGGFSAFASAPTSFAAVTQPQKTSAFGSTEAKPATTGGFGAFASNAPSAFGSTATTESKPISGGFGSFASSTPSAFGSTAPATPSPAPEQKPAGAFGSFAGSSSAFGSTAAPTATASDVAKPAEAAKTSILEAPFGASSTSSSISPFGGNDANKTEATKPSAETAQRTSVFGTPFGGASSSSTASPFGTAQAKSPFGGTAPVSPAESPTIGSFALSPPSSPEPAQKTGPPFGGAANTMPTTPSGGAFGNIQVTPSAFKPATGFGAFGSTTPTDSPFMKKPETTVPVSVFNLSSTPTKTPASSTASPAFGTTSFGIPSTLGAQKSPFTPASPASPTPAIKPATSSGGFSAFSGQASVFGTLGGSGKSFSDLLKTGGEETKDPAKPTVAAPATPPPKDKEEKGKEKDEDEKPKTRVSVFGTPVSAPPTEPETKDDMPISAFAPVSKSSSGSSEEKEEKKANDKSGSSGVSDEPSYGKISTSSAASSFVDVTEEDGRAEEGEEGSEGEDGDGFLTESNSEDGSYHPEESEEESDSDADAQVSDEEGEGSPEPASIPLPSSRSASATPQPEVPKIEVSSSPDDSEGKSPSPKTPVREASTTPPGTPAKETKPLFGTPGPSTPPTTGTPTPFGFGLGLGRPSTKPTRSSPLANAVTQEDEEEDGATKSPIPPPVSPRPISRRLPVEPEGSKKKSPTPEPQPPSAKRPKTPPLLSTIPTPAMTVPLSATPTTASSTESSGSKASPFGLPGVSSTSFGILPSTKDASPPKDEPVRAAAAPPAPAMFGLPLPATAATPSTKPTNVFGTGIFGVPATTSSIPVTPSTTGARPPGYPPTPPLFGVPPTPLLTPSTSTASAPPIWGQPRQAPTMPTPGSIFGIPPPGSGQGLFGMPPVGTSPPSKPAVPPPSLFGTITPVAPAHAPTPAPLAAQTPPAQSPQAPLEEGMQKECMNLAITMNRDLEESARVAKNAQELRTRSTMSLGGGRNKVDLGDPSKWSFSDLPQFGQVMKLYEKDLEYLASEREKQRLKLKEIQSNMLKAGTRREEIARFNKAKDDKEFAKMLRARTLGPEHSETQTQLRKSIRTIRDRVQKLEKRLQDDKKKLSQAQSCKPAFRAPSLDTINRTYRNIELAIEQQSDQVTRLTSRIGKLDLNAVDTSSPMRDARLPDRRHGVRPEEIVPNVAVTTAAALNAERSAQRLKKALLAVRKEPLLNTKALAAPKAPVAFNTPQRPGAGSNTGLPTGFAFQAPIKGSLFAETPSPVPLPDWNLDVPEDQFDPTATPLPNTRRGAGSGQRKHPSVPLKKSAGSSPGAPTTAAVPVAFDWGPLPSFSNPAPAAGLPRSFVPISPASSPTAKK